MARALASRPQIVFADEPTGNLDSRSGHRGAGVPAPRPRDEFGQTIVMVTHDPVAASYADTAVFLADGRVADASIGPPHRVLDHLKTLEG